jgi:hypothetical protein
MRRLLILGSIIYANVLISQVFSQKYRQVSPESIMEKFIVVIEIETGKEVKRLDVSTKGDRQINSIESGLNINLGDNFITKIIDNKGDVKKKMKKTFMEKK